MNVRMCGNPGCGGFPACSEVPAAPLAALADKLDLFQVDDARLLRIFAQELTLNYCTDDEGVKRMVPAGSQFTVHVTSAMAAVGNECVAVYSGPALTKAEWLAGSPEWSNELAFERLSHLEAANDA